MEALLQQLVAIREQVDAAIMVVADLLEAEPPPSAVDPGECEHKHTQTFQGAGPGPERIYCVDCGKEV